MKYNLVIFGTKDTTQYLIDLLIKSDINVDLIITVPSKLKSGISGYSNLKIIFESLEIPIYVVERYDLLSPSDLEFFRNNQFGIGVAYGWQRLIPLEILNLFDFGIFGFHGSSGYLPYGRGRSPFNWSIINGEKRIVLNLFKYDQYPDSPNVVENQIFEINQHDNIRTLQYKMLIISGSMIIRLYQSFLQNKISFDSFSRDFDTLFKKRTKQDGKISFSWNTDKIYNLVRAVTKPFPGAFAYIDNYEITIWELKPFDRFIDFSKYSPGEIVIILDNMIIVKTIDGSVIITSYISPILLKQSDVFT